MYNQLELYNEYKNDNKDSIVLLKYKNLYLTYEEDALILNKLFDYKMFNNEVAILYKDRDILMNKLDENKINFIICDFHDIKIYPYKNNNYNIVLEGIKCNLI